MSVKKNPKESSKITLMPVTYRWLGAAGLEFVYENYILLVDPFLTRPGKAAVLAGKRVRSNPDLIQKYLTGADAVLVTHPHYDHLLDVPEILRRTGARAFGSPNTCTLLALQGIEEKQVHAIHTKDQLNLGPFTVEVFPANHTRIPFSRWLNGSLPPGLKKKKRRRMPLRLSDYRMDVCYSFNIRVDNQVLQVGKYPTPANVLYISPYDTGQSIQTVLQSVQPRWIVPIHWDDFTRPLSRPLRTMLLTPAQGVPSGYLPVRRLDLFAFQHTVQQILPEAEVQIPEIFKSYTLG